MSAQHYGVKKWLKSSLCKMPSGTFVKISLSDNQCHYIDLLAFEYQAKLFWCPMSSLAVVSFQFTEKHEECFSPTTFGPHFGRTLTINSPVLCVCFHKDL